MKKAVIGLAITFLAVLAFSAMLEDHADLGENLESVSWLPNGASNVSYFDSYLFTAYEFDISETGFRQWSQWPMSEINQTVKIPRYLVQAQKISQPDSADAADEEWLAFHAAQENQYATIDDGLYYENERRNGGGVWVGYDRSTGRAFFKSNPR